MSRIYKTQDYLRIELSYEADVSSDINTVVIKYIDPLGGTGQWNAIHDALNKKVVYNFPQGEFLDIEGRWTIWSVATMNDGRILPGDPFKFPVSTEGT